MNARAALLPLLAMLAITMMGCPTPEADPADPEPTGTGQEGEADSHVISQGEELDVAKHLDPQAYLLVEFSADW